MWQRWEGEGGAELKALFMARDLNGSGSQGALMGPSGSSGGRGREWVRGVGRMHGGCPYIGDGGRAPEGMSEELTRPTFQGTPHPPLPLSLPAASDPLSPAAASQQLRTGSNS